MMQMLYFWKQSSSVTSQGYEINTQSTCGRYTQNRPTCYLQAMNKTSRSL